MATVLSTRERLAAIAGVLDAAGAGCDADLHVHVTDDGDALVLGVRQLLPEVHPYDELRGTVAPPEWWAVGVVVHGRARFLDEPAPADEPILSTYLVARDGSEVSLLRRGDRVTELVGPALGRLPDVCRSMLGLTAAG